MDRSFPSPSVVVGIDGSKPAIRAALWAVDEAVHRDIPLRLVCVIDAAAHRSAEDDHRRDGEYTAAYRDAHEAWRAVESTGKPVKIEMEILRGDPVTELVEASRHAALICLGSRGRHEHHGRRRGATATTVAETALCSAAIIRRQGPLARPEDGRIVALLDDSPASLAVLQTAVDEARLRNSSVLVVTTWSVEADGHGAARDEYGLRAELDHHLDASERGEADSRMLVRPMPRNIRKTLAHHADIDQLAIVGKSAPDLTAELIGAKGRSKLGKTSCSVLIVR